MLIRFVTTTLVCENKNNGDKLHHKKSMWAADEKLIINELGPYSKIVLCVCVCVCVCLSESAVGVNTFHLKSLHNPETNLFFVSFVVKTLIVGYLLKLKLFSLHYFWVVSSCPLAISALACGSLMNENKA